MVRSRNWLFALALAGVAAFTNCGVSIQPAIVAEAKASVGAPSPNAAEAPGHRRLLLPRDVAAGWEQEGEDAARFLAGLPGRAGSPYKALEAEEMWPRHSEQFSAGWRQFGAERLPRIQDFVKSELKEEATSRQALFYPFGGPDIMTASALFPHASTYLLVGLEPPGTVPDMMYIVTRRLEHVLPAYQNAFNSILTNTFFITREMDQQFRGQLTDGLLPVMLVQLARCGFTVDAVRYVNIDGEGELFERMARPGYPPAKNDGVVVDFHGASGGTRQLVYVYANLSDEVLAQNLPFQRLVKRLGPMNSMFKSTSYMPHRDEFSLIRRMVLDQSSAVLQDDSGIPFRFYEAAQWDRRVYGKYDRPYGSFRYIQQLDLKAALADPQQARPLPFPIGYGSYYIPSNLLVAVRR